MQPEFLLWSEIRAGQALTIILDLMSTFMALWCSNFQGDRKKFCIQYCSISLVSYMVNEIKCNMQQKYISKLCQVERKQKPMHWCPASFLSNTDPAVFSFICVFIQCINLSALQCAQLYWWGLLETFLGKLFEAHCCGISFLQCLRIIHWHFCVQCSSDALTSYIVIQW